MTATLFAATVAFAAFGDSLGNIGDVRLKGRLGERLDAMIEKHVAARDVDYITAPFMEKTETKGWWQTEFWGKWMHAAVPYLRYVGNGESAFAEALADKRGMGNGGERFAQVFDSLVDDHDFGLYPWRSEEPCDFSAVLLFGKAGVQCGEGIG